MLDFLELLDLGFSAEIGASRMNTRALLVERSR